MDRLDFYFDYLSPYAYLASLEIGPVCERHGVELRLRPVLFAGLLDHWGQLGPAEIPPKGLHAFRECMRYAALHGIPLRSPRFHPFRPLTALRASLAEVAADEQARVVRTFFAHGWSRGGDMGDDTELAAALEHEGLDGAALIARSHDPKIKATLADETRAAVARGVFGIPTMIARDELFWGLDQLRYLELFLDGKDPLAELDFDQLGSQGRAAWRPAAGPKPD